MTMGKVMFPCSFFFLLLFQKHPADAQCPIAPPDPNTKDWNILEGSQSETMFVKLGSQGVLLRQRRWGLVTHLSVVDTPYVPVPSSRQAECSYVASGKKQLWPLTLLSAEVTKTNACNFNHTLRFLKINTLHLHKKSDLTVCISVPIGPYLDTYIYIFSRNFLSKGRKSLGSGSRISPYPWSGWG